MDEFKIGNAAMLKSGSRVMIVTGFSQRGNVWVEWPTGGTSKQTGELNFHEAALHPAELVKTPHR